MNQATIDVPLTDTTDHNPEWDRFLQESPLGQFQQSSRWAAYKAPEGWRPHRVLLQRNGAIAGGFQVIWKKTRLGRLGYVSKGPVSAAEDPAQTRQLVGLMKDTARELGLLALLSQPPDDERMEPSLYQDLGFVRSNPMQVIETTYLVDVQTDIASVRNRMRPGLRRDIRRARRQQVTVREGTEADLPAFFDLMAATCARQKTTPNPVSVDALRLLWRMFAPTGSVRMTLAGRDGCAPAAQLSLVFGRRVTLWKKGWDGTHADWYCNALLEDESLEWAQANGHQVCDFCSLGPATAALLLAGQEPDDNAISPRDRFNLRFGGYPKLLPPSLVYLPNPVSRWVYRNLLTRFARFR